MKYADDYLNLIKTNPVKIAYELGYTDLTDLHNDWIKKFIFAKEDYLLQAHRGSYKTTCLKVALPIIMTLLPDDNILMMRKAEPDEQLNIQDIGGEWYITSDHPMTKEHYISFAAYVSDSSVMIFRQYPEWQVNITIPMYRSGKLVWYCNECGLLCQELRPKR